MEGDNVCKAVQRELGADDVPNELFPQGIRVMHSVTQLGLKILPISFSLDIFTTSVDLMTGLSVGRLGKGRTYVVR